MKLNIQRFNSGTITFTASSKLQGKIVWTSTPNYSTNTNVITTTLYARRTDSYSTTGKGWTGQVVVDGSTHKFSGFSSSKTIGSSWVKFDDYSDTLTYSNDKTITISGYVKGPSGTSLDGVKSSGSGSAVLETLHTAPVVSITSVEEQTSSISSQTNFVQYLSKKRFTLSVTLYDSATLTSVTISNGTTTGTSSTNVCDIDFTDKSFTLNGNKVPITITVVDSANGTTTLTQEYDPILYVKPNVESLSTRRAGQLTGQVTLKTNGTYSTLLGSTPSVSYRYAEYTETPSWSSWTTLTPTYEDGEWSINETIGSTNPKTFDPEKTYLVQVYAYDTYGNSTTVQSKVALGEATWTEYKDRVDFKKLTIAKKEILAPYVLYEGNDSRTETSITLSDDASNYSYLEIFYEYYAGGYEINHSIRVYTPNGKIALLDGSYDNGTYLYFETTRYTINGTAITRSHGARWRFATGGANNTRTYTGVNDPSIWIRKVIGYK